jgi:phage terminase small subunit
MLDRHKRFAEEYSIHLNGAAAYKAVYPNVSDDSASSNAYKLLEREDIQQEITRLQEERSKRLMWSTDQILEQIRDIATSNKTSTSEKLKALEIAAKSLGMFRDKVEHSGNVSIVLGQTVEDWSE